jgi:hypothetical protein
MANGFRCFVRFAGMRLENQTPHTGIYMFVKHFHIFYVSAAMKVVV